MEAIKHLPIEIANFVKTLGEKQLTHEEKMLISLFLGTFILGLVNPAGMLVGLGETLRQLRLSKTENSK